MSDNELLLAISSMMDKKLEPLQKDISKLQDNVSDIKVEMRDIKAEMREIDTRIKRIEITQENEILPRLQNIEACYTSTYERYAREVDKIEGTVQDIKLMKKVITEHSIKLEKIS